MLIVDAHEDIAFNILEYGRNYTRSVAETRRLEAGGKTPERNGDTLLGWPEYQRGHVAVVFGTLFVTPLRRVHDPRETQTYADLQEAYRRYSAQLDVYHRLAGDHPDQFTLIETQGDLQGVLDAWEPLDRAEAEPAGQEEGEQREQQAPVGIVVLMEGAEGVRQPGELEEWWARGVRLIGPAWAGTRFCGGSGEPGPLTSEGFALLESMAGFGFTLDLSHMDEAAALQALDVYPGAIVASHANARALLKGTESNRHLTDRVIAGLLERDGVIGVVLINHFLQVGWKNGDSREVVPLEKVAAQIDYICQMAGDARHVGLGSDFDGGFGVQSVPAGIDSIADLQKLAPLLAERGYSDQDIASVFGRNWIALLQRTLPETV